VCERFFIVLRFAKKKDHRWQHLEKRLKITMSPPAAGIALPDDLLFMEVLVHLRAKCLCASILSAAPGALQNENLN
jgi:hypothetical protein